MLEIIAYLLVMILLIAGISIVVYGRKCGPSFLEAIGWIACIVAIGLFIAAYKHARNIEELTDSVVGIGSSVPDEIPCIDKNGNDIPCDQLQE
jgi:hypothetical protein